MKWDRTHGGSSNWSTGNIPASACNDRLRGLFLEERPGAAPDPMTRVALSVRCSLTRRMTLPSRSMNIMDVKQLASQQRSVVPDTNLVGPASRSRLPARPGWVELAAKGVTPFHERIRLGHRGRARVDGHFDRDGAGHRAYEAARSPNARAAEGRRAEPERAQRERRTPKPQSAGLALPGD